MKILRNKQLDDYILETISSASMGEKDTLTEREQSIIKNPNAMICKTSLDEKIPILMKLGKMFYFVGFSDNGIEESDFKKLFHGTFLNKKRTLKALNVAQDSSAFVLGNHSVMKTLHKAELFLSSEMYSTMRTLKMVNKKQAGLVHISQKEENDELRELFIQTTMRMFLSQKSLNTYCESIGISRKQYMVMSVIYIDGKPMVGKAIAEVIYRHSGVTSGTARVLGDLHKKGLVVQVKGNPSHNIKSKSNFGTAKHLWGLSDKGLGILMNVVDRFALVILPRTY